MVFGVHEAIVQEKIGVRAFSVENGDRVARSEVSVRGALAAVSLRAVHRRLLCRLILRNQTKGKVILLKKAGKESNFAKTA